jgi:hypothetical protein
MMRGGETGDYKIVLEGNMNKDNAPEIGRNLSGVPKTMGVINLETPL